MLTQTQASQFSPKHPRHGLHQYTHTRYITAALDFSTLNFDEQKAELYVKTEGDKWDEFVLDHTCDYLAEQMGPVYPTDCGRDLTMEFMTARVWEEDDGSEGRKIEWRDSGRGACSIL
jgi:hypothetical protein